MWPLDGPFPRIGGGSRRVAQAFDLAGITNTGGAPSFAFLAKGGYHERIRNGVCAERTKVASAASLPAPSTSSGQAIAKKRKDRAPSNPTSGRHSIASVTHRFL